MKQLRAKTVKIRVNKSVLLLLLIVFSSSIYAQRVFVPKTRPNVDKTKGVDIDSIADSSTSSTQSGQKIDTSIDYDVTDLFNLDLSENERAQAKAIIEVFTEQIAEDTTDIAAYINRGSYWATLGLHVQAIKDYDRAVEIDADQPIIYYNRALSKARFFYTYDACLDLKKARDLGLQQADVLMNQQCGRHMAKLNAVPSAK